jgi:hypothetical protein
MDKIYFDALKNTLDLLEELNKDLAPYLESINSKITMEMETSF